MTSPRDDGTGYEDVAFAGRGASVRAFLAAVAERIPAAPGQRALDLGCGTGDAALALAARMPGLHVVGLDLSRPNIDVAIARAGEAAARDRVQFAAADYRSWDGGSFDVIAADSVLHLIPMDDARLAAKLAADLKPGGLLIMTMPDGRPRNRLLVGARKIWRLMPRAFDRLALRLARAAHPGEQQAVLADRIGYLRIVPERLHAAALASVLHDTGFELVESREWPSPSLFKLGHRLFVYRRR